MKITTIVLSLSLFIISPNICTAQQGVVSSGGEATGSGGSVSYSTGQVFFETISNESGSVAPGLQQPFEIFIITGVDQPGITLDWKVFPNPVSNMLFLDVDNNAGENLSYKLFNASGELIDSGRINDKTTSIDMHGNKTGIYILSVEGEGNILKQFKIIRH